MNRGSPPGDEDRTAPAPQEGAGLLRRRGGRGLVGTEEARAPGSPPGPPTRLDTADVPPPPLCSIFRTSVPGARHRPLAPPGVLSSHVTSCQRRVSSHDGASPRSMLLRRTSLSCPAFRARASGRFSGAFPGPGFWWVLASASLLLGHLVAMTTRISDIQAQALAVKTRPGPKMPTSGSGFRGGQAGDCRLRAPSGSGFRGGGLQAQGALRLCCPVA